MDLAFLASHRGSRMQPVLDACRAGRLRARPCVVMSKSPPGRRGEHDHGAIVAPARVPVVDGDSAETLAPRVLQHGHRLLVETLERIVAGELVLPG